MICAWCPGFDRNDPKNKHASHGICPSCRERFVFETMKRPTRTADSSWLRRVLAALRLPGDGR